MRKLSNPFMVSGYSGPALPLRKVMISTYWYVQKVKMTGLHNEAAVSGLTPGLIGS